MVKLWEKARSSLFSWNPYLSMLNSPSYFQNRVDAPPNDNKCVDLVILSVFCYISQLLLFQHPRPMRLRTLSTSTPSTWMRGRWQSTDSASHVTAVWRRRKGPTQRRGVPESYPTTSRVGVHTWVPMETPTSQRERKKMEMIKFSFKEA